MPVRRVIREPHIPQTRRVPPHVIRDLRRRKTIRHARRTRNRTSHHSRQQPIRPVKTRHRRRRHRRRTRRRPHIRRTRPIPRQPSRSIRTTPTRPREHIRQLMPRNHRRHQPPRSVIPIRRLVPGRSGRGALRNHTTRLRPHHGVGHRLPRDQPLLPDHPLRLIPTDTVQRRPIRIHHLLQPLQRVICHTRQLLPIDRDGLHLAVGVIRVRRDRRSTARGRRRDLRHPPRCRVIRRRRHRAPHIGVTDRASEQIGHRRDRRIVRRPGDRRTADRDLIATALGPLLPWQRSPSFTTEQGSRSE